MKPCSLLLLASLLTAARNPNSTLVMPEPHHHSHKHLWITLGIVAAAAVTAGVLIEEHEHHGPPKPTLTCFYNPPLCELKGAR